LQAAESLFCFCGASAADPWETHAAATYDEQVVLVETASKDVVIIWDKLGKPQQQRRNDSEVVLRELRSSPSIDDTCTTASMNTVSFDAWDDGDDEDDSIMTLNKIPDLAL
jgi:hypothetical protein